MLLFGSRLTASSREKEKVDTGGEVWETKPERQEVGMYSRMVGKARVVMAIFGVALSISGFSALRGDGVAPAVIQKYAFEVFRARISCMSWWRILKHWEGCIARYAKRKEGMDKGDMEPYETGYVCFPSGSWSPFRDMDLPALKGDLPLKSDACISDKIEKSIIEEGECAKRIREYLEFLTSPRFACVFFPLEMFRFCFSRSVDIYNRYEVRWVLRGELSCDLLRKKLRKDSKHFDAFGKYIFYLVRYKEKLSGCIFEMLYCFDANGVMVGWCPSKLMAVWASQVDGRHSVEKSFLKLASLPIQPFAGPFSMREFE